MGRFSFLFLLPAFVSSCAVPPRGVVILCAGDSITAKAYPHFLQRRLNKDGILARVVNFGVSGDTSGEYLRYIRKKEVALQAYRPDFILIQLGTNDVRTDSDFTPTDRFVANMREILAFFKTFRTRTAEHSMIFLAQIPPLPPEAPFPFAPESARRVVEEINPAIAALSREENVPLIDNYRLQALGRELVCRDPRLDQVQKIATREPAPGGGSKTRGFRRRRKRRRGGLSISLKDGMIDGK